MAFIKTLLILLSGFIIGFGFWYLIFWFLTNESNLFEWFWLTKIAYLILSTASTSGTIEAFIKD